MIINLEFQLERELILPLGYNRYVQSAVYNLLRLDEEYSEFLHSRGYKNGSLPFRLFTFSDLRGKYRIENKKIIFFSRVFLELRSVSEEFVYILMNALNKARSMELNGQKLYLKECLMGRKLVLGEKQSIITRTPVVLSKTLENGFRKYYSPAEPEFAVLADSNFRKKYAAYFKREPKDGIKLTFKSGTDRHIVTKYKQTIINAYHGRFVIEGSEEHLQFLFDTGLGSKNAQGFGMFDIE